MSDREGSAPLGLPLQGVRVLDFTRVISGPFLTMTMANLGAEVIKIENPDGGDDTRGYLPQRDGETANFIALNRLKKSVVLDLSLPGDRALAADLATQSPATAARAPFAACPATTRSCKRKAG